MGTRKVIIDGQLVAEITLPEGTTEERWREVLAAYLPLEEKTLQELKEEALNKIYEYARTKYQELIADYSLAETASWTRKEQEARDYLSTGVIAPTLKKEAIARYRTSENQAIRKLSEVIVQKATYLHDRSSKISGTRGRHIDTISAFTTKEQVEGYNWLEGWE